MKIFLFCLIALIPSFALSRSAVNFMPSSQIYPSLSGILFPNIVNTGGVNAAALPLAGKGTAIQGAYSGGGSAEAYQGAVSATSKNFGINAGYLGVKADSSSSLLHNTFVGAGFLLDPIAVGLGVRSIGLSGTSATHHVDLGLIAGQGKGLTFGFVIYDINTAAILDIGVGFGGGKKYNMEANLLIPQLTGKQGSTALTLAGTITPVDAFGMTFKTTYYLDYSTYQHLFGITVWPWQSVGFFGQYATQNTWTGGLNLSF